MNEETINNMINAERKFIESIKNHYDSNERMFVQIYHRSLFSNELTIKGIFDLVDADINDRYPRSKHAICYDKDSECIMIVGNIVTPQKSLLDK